MRSGENPWLSIPAADYEGHMNSPNVGQLPILREVFAKNLREFKPSTISVLGCATGNGFECIDFSEIKKVFALDINPEYLAILEDRFSKQKNKIVKVCCDLADFEVPTEKVEFIYAALVFEFLDPSILLPKLCSWLQSGGRLAVVLQKPSEEIAQITPSKFSSIKNLAGLMKLVPTEGFIKLAEETGLRLIHRRNHVIPTGKSFSELVFSS